MAKYVDVCILPIAKKHVANYKKNTTGIGKILLKHGALASRDYVADDKNALTLFGKKLKAKTGEVFIIALAEFNSKAHREKVFKLMAKDPGMEKFMSDNSVDPKRMIMGGFKALVDLEK